MSGTIGTVSSIAGEFFIIRLNGSTAKLSKHDEIYEGDVVQGLKDTTELNRVVVSMSDGVDIVTLGNESQLFDSSLLQEEFSEDETVNDIHSIEAMVNDSDFIDSFEDDIDTEAGEEDVASSSTEAPMANFAQINEDGVDINAELRDVDIEDEEAALDHEYDVKREAITANSNSITANIASIDVANTATELDNAMYSLNTLEKNVDTPDVSNAVNDESTLAVNTDTFSETIIDTEIADIIQNVLDLGEKANQAADAANIASQNVRDAVALTNSNPTVENLNIAQNLQEAVLEAANNSLNIADALENAISELNDAAIAANIVVDSTILSSANDAVENVDSSADNANKSANINLNVSIVSDSDISDNTIEENVADGTYTGVTLNAVDVDGGVIVYSVADGVPFSVNADGQVLTSGAINFEANPSYTFDVTATSSDGSTSTVPITIDVNNINEAPTITDTQTVSMSEDSLKGFSGYGDTWSGDIYSIITQEEMLNHLNISDAESSSFSVTLANTDDSSSYHHGLQATDSVFSNSTSNRDDEQVIQITEEFLDVYPQVDAKVGDFYFDNVEFDKLGEGDSANISFGVVVSDGELLSEAKTVNIEVKGSNDAPVIIVKDTTVIEDIAQVIANVSDIDGTIDTSTLSAENGIVTIADNGAETTKVFDVTVKAVADTPTLSISIADSPETNVDEKADNDLPANSNCTYELNSLSTSFNFGIVHFMEKDKNSQHVATSCM
jgi:hypothetical protein